MSTTKGSTRMTLVHVQKMYKTCTFSSDCRVNWTQVAPSYNIFRILIEVLPEHAPVRGCQNKRLGGTIGYYYDEGGL